MFIHGFRRINSSCKSRSRGSFNEHNWLVSLVLRCLLDVQVVISSRVYAVYIDWDIATKDTVGISYWSTVAFSLYFNLFLRGKVGIQIGGIQSRTAEAGAFINFLLLTWPVGLGESYFCPLVSGSQKEKPPACRCGHDLGRCWPALRERGSLQSLFIHRSFEIGRLMRVFARATAL